MVIAAWDAIIGRHNSPAQKLEAEIIRMVSAHCHAHHLATAVAVLPQICTAYENVKAL